MRFIEIVSTSNVTLVPLLYHTRIVHLYMYTTKMNRTCESLTYVFFLLISFIRFFFFVFLKKMTIFNETSALLTHVM